MVCEWAFCGRHGQASSRLWSQRWWKTALCGPAVQRQEETHTNEMVPYSTAFVMCAFFKFCAHVSALVCFYSPCTVSFILLLFFFCSVLLCPLLPRCRAVTRKSSIWVERDEWCCMVKFNTYLDYSYRFLWFGMWSRFPC